jgi:hypothetical protein
MTSPNDNAHFDFSPYLSTPRFDAPHGTVLAAQLQVAAPVDLDARGKEALAEVHTQAARVTAVLVQRAQTSTGGLRPVLAAVDTAYGALYGRLTAAAKLPEAQGDLGARAVRVLEAVLVDGLAFLQNDAETKYAESERLLLVIDQQHLAAEIDHVAGAQFLAVVKTAHAALGEALGVGATPVFFERAELQAALADLSQAILHYCVQLVASTDASDATSVRRFRSAVMPIDRFRADRPEAKSGEDDASTPTPTPQDGPFITPNPT